MIPVKVHWYYCSGFPFNPSLCGRSFERDRVTTDLRCPFFSFINGRTDVPDTGIISFMTLSFFLSRLLL